MKIAASCQDTGVVWVERSQPSNRNRKTAQILYSWCHPQNNWVTWSNRQKHCVQAPICPLHGLTTHFCCTTVSCHTTIDIMLRWLIEMQSHDVHQNLTVNKWCAAAKGQGQVTVMLLDVVQRSWTLCIMAAYRSHIELNWIPIVQSTVWPPCRNHLLMRLINKMVEFVLTTGMWVFSLIRMC